MPAGMRSMPAGLLDSPVEVDWALETDRSRVGAEAPPRAGSIAGPYADPRGGPLAVGLGARAIDNHISRGVGGWGEKIVMILIALGQAHGTRSRRSSCARASL